MWKKLQNLKKNIKKIPQNDAVNAAVISESDKTKLEIFGKIDCFKKIKYLELS